MQRAHLVEQVKAHRLLFFLALLLDRGGLGGGRSGAATGSRRGTGGGRSRRGAHEQVGDVAVRERRSKEVGPVALDTDARSPDDLVDLVGGDGNLGRAKRVSE